jgi:hypothetical protein
VTLTADLDRKEPAEQALVLLTKKHRLRISYQVRVDLARRGQEVIDTFHQLLEGNKKLDTFLKARGRLRKPEGEEEQAVRTLLATLAGHGENLFNDLFGELDELDEAPEDTMVFRDAIKSLFTRKRIIEIDTLKPLFPWALLFYDPEYQPRNEQSLKPTNFWGFKHDLYLQMPRSSKRPVLGEPRNIVAAICPVEADELPSGHDPFAGLPVDALKPVRNVEDLKRELIDFKGNVFYFYGHAGPHTPPTPRAG